MEQGCGLDLWSAVGGRRHCKVVGKHGRHGSRYGHGSGTLDWVGFVRTITGFFEYERAAWQRAMDEASIFLLSNGFKRAGTGEIRVIIGTLDEYHEATHSLEAPRPTQT